MKARLLLPAVLLLVAAAGPVGEVEPDGVSAPQSVGTLSPTGIQIAGTIDPTSPNGLAPGDQDAFSFTMGAAGPFTATVDDGEGTTFVLALSRTGPPTGSLLGAVMGPAPLTLAVPGLLAGSDYAVAVTALGGGAPVSYSLALGTASASLPGWSGADCPGEVVESEPNDTTVAATDLGDYTGVLCGSGTLSSVVPPDPDNPGIGDVDTFRFRNVLPVAARLVFQSDPGLLQVEVQALVFVGPFPIASGSFGEAGEVVTPALLPGEEYLIQIHADQGTAPLAYSFFLEPASPEPPAEPEPMEVRRSTVHLAKKAGAASFDVRGLMEAGVGADVPAGAVFSYEVRGVGQVFAAGLLQMDDLGRLTYKALPRTPGLKSLFFDPFLGTVHLRGKGIDWGEAGDPSDTDITVEVTVGDVSVAGTGSGRGKGRTLKVK